MKFYLRVLLYLTGLYIFLIAITNVYLFNSHTFPKYLQSYFAHSPHESTSIDEYPLLFQPNITDGRCNYPKFIVGSTFYKNVKHPKGEEMDNHCTNNTNEWFDYYRDHNHHHFQLISIMGENFPNYSLPIVQPVKRRLKDKFGRTKLVNQLLVLSEPLLITKFQENYRRFLKLPINGHIPILIFLRHFHLHFVDFIKTFLSDGTSLTKFFKSIQLNLNCATYGIVYSTDNTNKEKRMDEDVHIITMIIKEYFRHHQSFSQHPLYQHHYESLTKETVNIEIKTDFSKIICQINGKHKYIQQFQHLIKRDTKSPFTNNKKQSVIIDRVQSMNEAMTLYFSPRIDCLMEAATTKKLIKKILVDYFKLFRLPKSHKTKEKKMKMFVVQLFKDKTKFYDSSNLNDDIELLKVKCFPTWTGENVGFLQDYLYRYVTNQSPIKMSIFKLPKFYYETLFIHELTGKPFNIMNLIIDSVSRIDFYRNAPRSMEYLNRLNMIDLEWANILGDGTTAYIVPLVVGRMMEDRTFPATLLFRREYVDKFYETIFHRFHKSNFITSFNEDNAYIATFNARMKGFSTKPSDYYSRMLYLSSPARLGQHRCMGRKTLFNIWLENFYETHQLYTNSSTPYMAIGHTAETHTGRIGSIKPHDHHLLEFLKRMNETNLNGTFLIIQSDHGARYTEYRRTVIGKQEERNPGFFVVTSSSRLRVIFSLYRQRLITAFDHYHLLNVIANATNAYHNLHVNSNKILSFVDASQFNRSKDLLYLNKLIDLETSNRAFSFIPSFSNKYITLYRKCQQSGITPHWCNCMNWRTVPKANQSLIAKAALSSFNGFISQHVILKEKCSMWKLEEIVEMTILTPTSSLLNHTTADQLKKKEYTFVNKDGLTTFYQMKLKLTPVTQQYIAIFEMTILKENGKFKFEQNSLSRLDSYGSQADCLSEKVFARICYCKKF